jgi:hypothetical protein
LRLLYIPTIKIDSIAYNISYYINIIPPKPSTIKGKIPQFLDKIINWKNEIYLFNNNDVQLDIYSWLYKKTGDSCHFLKPKLLQEKWWAPADGWKPRLAPIPITKLPSLSHHFTSQESISIFSITIHVYNWIFFLNYLKKNP